MRFVLLPAIALPCLRRPSRPSAPRIRWSRKCARSINDGKEISARSAARQRQLGDQRGHGGLSWRRHQPGASGPAHRRRAAQRSVIQNGLKYLRTIELEPGSKTYVVGLQTMAYAQAGQAVDRERIQKNTTWLQDAQKDNGWSYGRRGDPDNSNTQYAVLGLHAGIESGVRVEKRALENIRRFMVDSQIPKAIPGRPGTGGWAYKERDPPSMTMTCAGLSNLMITGMDLDVEQTAHGRRGHQGLRVVRRGRAGRQRPALDQPALPGRNPGRQRRHAARPGSVLCPVRHRTHRPADGPALPRRPRLVRDRLPLPRQHPEKATAPGRDSATSTARPSWPPASPCCSSPRGERPSSSPSWPTDRATTTAGTTSTATRVTSSSSPAASCSSSQPLAWQIFDVRGDARPITRRTAASWLPSCCRRPSSTSTATTTRRATRKRTSSRSTWRTAASFSPRPAAAREFRPRFREARSSDIFRDSELKRLPDDHPIWTASGKFLLTPNKPFPLYGVQHGCKWVAVFSPQPLAYYWEANDFDRSADGKIAFQLAANIIAYATGLEPPRPRLTEVDIPRNDSRERSAPRLFEGGPAAPRRRLAARSQGHAQPDERGPQGRTRCRPRTDAGVSRRSEKVIRLSFPVHARPNRLRGTRQGREALALQPDVGRPAAGRRLLRLAAVRRLVSQVHG